MNFIFETSELQFASPATVSRMGMIYLNSYDTPIGSLIQNFTSQHPSMNLAPL